MKHAKQLNTCSCILKKTGFTQEKLKVNLFLLEKVFESSFSMLNATQV